MRKEAAMNIILVVLVIAVVLIGLTFVKAKQGKGSDSAKYKRRPLMTDNELEFFGRLVAALPDHYIFPQVSMGALLEPISTDKKKAFGDRNRIAQKRIDYVVCNKRCEVVAVVELDDRTHSRAKDKVRDEMLEQAAIRTVRFQSRQKPAAEVIRATVLQIAAPAPAPSVVPAVAAQA